MLATTRLEYMITVNNVSVLQYMPLSLPLPSLECIMWKTHYWFDRPMSNPIIWICTISFWCCCKKLHVSCLGDWWSSLGPLNKTALSVCPPPPATEFQSPSQMYKPSYMPTDDVPVTQPTTLKHRRNTRDRNVVT